MIHIRSTLISLSGKYNFYCIIMLYAYKNCFVIIIWSLFSNCFDFILYHPWIRVIFQIHYVSISCSSSSAFSPSYLWGRMSFMLVHRKLHHNMSEVDISVERGYFIQYLPARSRTAYSGFQFRFDCTSRYILLIKQDSSSASSSFVEATIWYLLLCYFFIQFSKRVRIYGVSSVLNIPMS